MIMAIMIAERDVRVKYPIKLKRISPITIALHAMTDATLLFSMHIKVARKPEITGSIIKPSTLPKMPIAPKIKVNTASKVTVK